MKEAYASYSAYALYIYSIVRAGGPIINDIGILLNSRNCVRLKIYFTWYKSHLFTVPPPTIMFGEKPIFAIGHFGQKAAKSRIRSKFPRGGSPYVMFKQSHEKKNKNKPDFLPPKSF